VTRSTEIALGRSRLEGPIFKKKKMFVGFSRTYFFGSRGCAHAAASERARCIHGATDVDRYDADLQQTRHG